MNFTTAQNVVNYNDAHDDNLTLKEANEQIANEVWSAAEGMGQSIIDKVNEIYLNSIKEYRPGEAYFGELISDNKLSELVREALRERLAEGGIRL